MAPGVLNSPTSSHTLTASFSPQPTTEPPSSCMTELFSTLSASSHTFLKPPATLHTAALRLAKSYLDPLASSVSQAQELRLQDARKKRKRGEVDEDGARNILRLKQVHLDGFGIDQIWEQARRVLDASRQEIERSLPKDLGDNTKRPEKVQDGVHKQVKMVPFDEDGFEVGNASEDAEADDREDGGTSDEEIEKDGDGDEIDVEEDDLEEEEDIEYDGADLGMDEDMDNDIDGAGAEIFKPDKFGLNDGFFSIEDFNRQSEFLEQQGARGDDDGQASDEEEVDWDADPMAQTAQATNSKRPADDDEPFGSSDDEEDGPTFGNADLNAPFSDSGEEDDEVMPPEDTTLSNTNEIKYADFFAPPPLPASKRPKGKRPLPKTQPPPSTQGPTEDDIQRTISAVRRDLFEDDFSAADDASEDEDLDNPDNPENPSTARLSTHEKRQLKLAAQIRNLEAENVAKRNWTLAGEARAAERPINSLLEEDLEFERTGKPVPVITAAVSEDIEALIKRRILAREFDEVIRRRPESLNAPPDVKRGRVELEDTKSKVGLGELYAEEHLKTIDPEGFMATRDAGLKKQHEEIERLWAAVSAKLDALSSWHYRPKPPEVKVQVLADVPAVRMEEARPTGVGGVGAGEGESRLAPQEVFSVGEGVGKGAEEVVAGAGMVARQEMTREEKLRRRRREKERVRKMEGGKRRGVDGKVGKGGKGREEGGKHEVVDALRRGGVRVIGKKGEVTDVEGKMVARREGGMGGGGFKL
ncbi:U3 snoRNP protein [Trapelia coarctata]|nr:U3 snoRNP protein [Trapelia coarctata]